jgi:hypothetical protein
MDDDERCDLVSRLFAVMTADLEDAAALAVDGQGTDVEQDHRLKLAASVHDVAQRTAVIADAAAAILERLPSSQ